MGRFGLAAGGALVALVALASCDDKKTTSTPSDLSPAAKAKWSEYCAQRTAYVAECSPTAAPCPESMCLAQVYEDGPLIEYFDCQLAKSCSSFFNDDDCIATAGTSDAERDAFIARCAARLTACGLQSDSCAFGMPIVRKHLMQAVDACLTSQCAQILDCVAAIVVPDCF